MMSNDEIKQLDFTISNIVKVLKQFDRTDVLKAMDQNNHVLCIALGNTGCGKSTLLTALCFGKDAL